MQNAKFNLFPKGKKGFNDITILGVIGFIFFATAIMIPFVNAEFNIQADEFDTDNFAGNVRNDADNANSISAFRVLLTIFKLGIHDWGNTLNLPFWLDGIYTFLAIIFVVTIARNIWIGGGA